MIRIACAQLAPVLGDRAGNVRRTTEAIATAAVGGADVVVLPELALSGYAFASVEQARALATGVDELEEAWARPGVVVVGGFCEAGAGGRLFNSAAVVDETGVRAVYRKAHLWDGEPAFFTPGDAPPPVVETAAGRIAPLVCFDLFFPEWPRVAALAGAQLLCVPGNWPRGPRSFGRPVQLLRAMVAAEAGGMAVATCDRCGPERGAAWAGATGIAAPDGALLAAAAGLEPELVAADVELSAAGVPFRAARRAGLYGPVVEP